MMFASQFVFVASLALPLVCARDVGLYAADSSDLHSPTLAAKGGPFVYRHNNITRRHDHDDDDNDDDDDDHGHGRRMFCFLNPASTLTPDR